MTLRPIIVAGVVLVAMVLGVLLHAQAQNASSEKATKVLALVGPLKICSGIAYSRGSKWDIFAEGKIPDPGTFKKPLANRSPLWRDTVTVDSATTLAQCATLAGQLVGHGNYQVGCMNNGAVNWGAEGGYKPPGTDLCAWQ